MNFFNFYKNSEEVSNICKTSSKNIGELRKKFLCKNNNLNLNDNKLLLFTTAVDQKYRLSALHFYLKSNVKKQLKLNVKKHIDFEADQSVDSPKLLPEKPKPQPSLNLNPYKFSTYYSLFEA